MSGGLEDERKYLARHGGAVEGVTEARVVEEDGADEVTLEVELQLQEEGEEREGGVEVDVVGVSWVVLHPLQVHHLPHVLLTVAQQRRAHQR
ncbi:hypothetical protein E2562_031588 [Oryza meyeriana var. granulata]|uniref:Uncharacterized protein n=1 Tax=Oryza meyeriana var. granulata TaxID=110450 RepID=A0A6G1CK20_9ORYZ|nr:hypothetical protein E2562_031588 [Oryza meyeriana var. granulata]